MKLSRRKFIQSLTAAVVAPAFIPAGALGRSGRPAPSERVRLGAIGVGGMGRTDLFNLTPLPEVDVVAICDVDDRQLFPSKQLVTDLTRGKKGQESFKGPDTYKDFRELLARDDIDAVVVATPPHSHAWIEMAALKAGKDVYGEKPMCRTIAEVRAVADTANRLGRVFQHGTQSRSNGQVRHAVELVRNGRIGQLQKIKVGIPAGQRGVEYIPEPVPKELDFDMWLGPAPYTPYHPMRQGAGFRMVLDFSAGIITDLGTHYLDIAQWASRHDGMGPVEINGKGVYPTGGVWNSPVFYDFTLTFADGVVYDCSAMYPQGVRFEGTEGWIYVPMKHPLPERVSEASDPRILKSVIQPHEERVYCSDHHWKNFIDCVKSRGKTITPAEVAASTTTLPHLGSIAIELQRKMQWDAKKGIFPGDQEANRRLDRTKRAPYGNYLG